jgi:hypothetical protein
MLRLAGPDGAFAALDDLGASPADIVTLLATSRLPEVKEVLDTIATVHPDKRLAKAARKSLNALRARSSGTRN